MSIQQAYELPPFSSLKLPGITEPSGPDEDQKSKLIQSANESNRPEFQERRIHLGISDTPTVANPTEVGDSFAYRQPIDMENGYSIPSPISPRRTRCPSLAESLYSVASSSTNSTTDNSPTTSSNNKEPGAPHYHHYHHHHQHRIAKSYRSPPPCRLPFDLPTPPSRYGTSSRPLEHKSEERLTKNQKNEKRRQNHLLSEKKRRENIKDGMDALFHLVPKCIDVNESKANILKLTKQYILELQKDLDRVMCENEELRRFSYGNSRLVCRL